MKKNKILFVFILLLATATVAFSSTFVYVKINEDMSMPKGEASSYDKDEFIIVTSCNPMYIATLNVCDGIEDAIVVNLSQPTTGCLHDYTLTTGDMKMLAEADAFVINGAGMEGYLSDVMEAYPDLYVVTASEGFDEENSHCWMSTDLYGREVENIAKGLAAVDDVNFDKYIANAKNYVERINTELSQYTAIAAASSANRNVMLFHEAFDFVAEDMWRQVVGVMDLDEERQVSAGELQEVVTLVAENGNCTIYAEEEYGSQMAELVSTETGCRVVYLNPMIRGYYNKDSYIEIMKDNYQKIMDCL